MRASRAGRAGRLLLRVLVAVVFLLPLFWTLAAALHPPGVPLPRSLNLLPEGISTANVGRVLALVPYGRFTLNSLLVVALAVPLTLLISSWAGFSMAQLPRRSQRRWVTLSLAVLMVPGIGLWATRFLIYEQLGWLDTIWALIAPAWMGTSPFFVLMFYRAFRRIPAALYEAARLDGAGAGRVWGAVALPIARPTAVAVAILSFIVYWGDFVSPLLYLSSQDRYTLPVALQLIQQMARSDWSLLMAAALLAMIVPILLFVLVQPYFAQIGR